MEKFDNEIAEILEVDSVKMDDQLVEFDCWDSLTILSIIAYASETYHVTISSAEINNSQTVGGLKLLFQSKIK
jgi:acyl carrier protein